MSYDENFVMSDERLKLFMEGKLTAYEPEGQPLTEAEVEWLEDATRAAIMGKIQERGTLQ